jgi:hypothetical protein
MITKDQVQFQEQDNGTTITMIATVQVIRVHEISKHAMRGQSERDVKDGVKEEMRELLIRQVYGEVRKNARLLQNEIAVHTSTAQFDRLMHSPHFMKMLRELLEAGK